ncbi:FMN-dependent NADH-azoreductase [Thiomicrorhabdus indica]|uniref:FMN-dependent NADH-azoreductase n=1 Tax=Thiomicrorhabdus indica TaxID=2267253 RepID=UPI002AA80C0D|nr:NAD(P)H-dependent oxidoreductase [Thiomicrorhabdus indica]
MKRLLRIDASANPSSSVSRELADQFESNWKQNNPAGEVYYRDLSIEPPNHLSPQILAAMFSPEPTVEQQALLTKSVELIEELKSADTVLVATPMYNFGIPSTLKSYFDHIARAGLTFQYTEQGPQGLIEGINAVAIVSSGGDYRQPPLDSMNFVDGYLKTIFGFMGIEDVTLIHAAGLAMGEEQAKKAKQEASEAIQKYFKTIEETLFRW